MTVWVPEGWTVLRGKQSQLERRWREQQLPKLWVNQSWTALKNATLYAKQKTANGGEVRFELGEKKLQITSSDNFVSVCNTVPTLNDIPAEQQGMYYLDASDVKTMERYTRDLVGKQEHWSFEFKEYQPVPKEPQWWEAFDGIMRDILRSPTKLTTFDINPERLALLSRLEPKGSYVLSWLAFKHQSTTQLAFRYGPDTVGLLVPLNRDKLPTEQKMWVWV